MNAPPNHISVVHGSLNIFVPRDIFKGPKAEIDEKKASEFRDMIAKRYPWMTPNSLDVLMRHARQEMLRVMDEETGGRSTSRNMVSDGNTEMAIKHLEARLKEDPNNADSWYALGELLCKSGRVEEGYRAINKGRSLVGSK